MTDIDVGTERPDVRTLDVVDGENLGLRILLDDRQPASLSRSACWKASMPACAPPCESEIATSELAVELFDGS